MRDQGIYAFMLQGCVNWKEGLNFDERNGGTVQLSVPL